jgi:DNA-binding MarR family transcriptional regulator
MKNKPLRKINSRLYILLNQARDAALAAREKELSQYGISASEASVIDAIALNDNNITPAEISRRILREAHTVFGILKRMEKKGLITRERNTHRKNIWQISLTEHGLQAFEQSAKQKSVDEILSFLSDKDAERLLSYLRDIRNQSIIYKNGELNLPSPY